MPGQFWNGSVYPTEATDSVWLYLWFRSLYSTTAPSGVVAVSWGWWISASWFHYTRPLLSFSFDYANFFFFFLRLTAFASLVTQNVKHLPAMQETRVQSLGLEAPLEKEMVTHSSIPAWRIPCVEEPGRLQSKGSQRVGQDWATSLSLSLTATSFMNNSYFGDSQGFSVSTFGFAVISDFLVSGSF